MDSQFFPKDSQGTRLEKVLALRQALDKGAYHVSAEQLADAMLAKRDQGTLFGRLNIRHRPLLH